MSLLAWYKLNDNAANTTVADASGNGNTAAAARNTSLFTATGKIDAGLNFNGSSDYASRVKLVMEGPLSMFAWFNPSAIQRGAIVWNYNTQRIYYGINEAGKLFFRNRDTGDVALSNAAVASVGVWGHYGVVVAADGTPTLYVNGATTAQAATAVGYQTAPVDFRIGMAGGSDYYTAGIIDDVRIYNETLTPWRIRALYNLGRGSGIYDPWRRSVGLSQNRIRRVT